MWYFYWKSWQTYMLITIFHVLARIHTMCFHTETLKMSDRSRTYFLLGHHKLPNRTENTVGLIQSDFLKLIEMYFFHLKELGLTIRISLNIPVAFEDLQQHWLVVLSQTGINQYYGHLWEAFAVSLGQGDGYCCLQRAKLLVRKQKGKGKTLRTSAQEGHDHHSHLQILRRGHGSSVLVLSGAVTKIPC